MSRRSSVVLGAILGAPVFALVALAATWTARELSGNHYTATPWGTISMLIGLVVGLVFGGIEGSRAGAMTPAHRATLLAIGVVVLLASIGGSIGVLIRVWGGYDNHGMRDFLVGAVPGAIVGLSVAGVLVKRWARRPP